MKILCLFFLLASLQVEAQTNQLTLHFLPSPKGLNWESPQTLAWSGIQNRWASSSRFIGHVFVELECRGQHELTGMRARTFDYFTQLLWENRGLGVLFHSFEGRLEEKSELASELAQLKKDSKVNFARFLLNEGQCQRMSQYLKEYRSYGVEKNYGLANRPLHGEGAGCSAFGVSFLEVAGILDQELIDGWRNAVNIPLDLAGPPLRDEGVSFFKLLFNAQWAPENAPHKKLVFWDPDRMHAWVESKLKNPLPQGISTLTIEKTEGVVIDKSAWPVPEHPIWRQDLKALVR